MSLTQVLTPTSTTYFNQESVSSFLTKHAGTKHSADKIVVNPATTTPPASTNNAPERDPSMVIYDDFVRPDADKENTITVGGRKSLLAVVQSKNIAKSLYDINNEQSYPVVALSTLGDKVLSKPLYSFGGNSLWTKELVTLLLLDIVGLPKL